MTNEHQPTWPLDESLYRFGSIEINPQRACVLINAQERPLRYQSFQVLLYLIEHTGRVVTKNELAEHVWQHASVTDNALVQCIAEIRRALHDDPRHSAYIKTVPKVGYRFTAECTRVFPTRTSFRDPSQEVEASPLAWPSRQLSHQVDNKELAEARDHAVVERVRPDSLQEEPAATVFCRPSEGSAALSPLTYGPRWSYARWFTGRRALWLVAAICVLIASMAGGFYFMPWHVASAHAHAGFPTAPPVASLQDFKDKTGQARLAWISEGFPAMLNADLSIIPGAARAAAGTTRAQVSGEVSMEGNRLRIDLTTRAMDGHLLAHDVDLAEQTEVAVEAGVFASRLANRLGVPPVIPRAGPALPVTTSSAEAYRYYCLGVKKAQRFETTEAIRLLKKALVLDPKFAMASARIGYSYAVVDFLPEQGLRYLERAQQLSSNLPEADQLLISSWTSIARRDYIGAERTFGLLTDRYPYTVEAWSQLGRLLRSKEKSIEAVEVLQNGLRWNPDAPAIYNVLGLVDMSLFRYTDAIIACQHAIALDPTDPNLKDTLGMAYQQSGQYYAAIALYTMALSDDPEFEPALVHMGDAYYQLGRYREAVAQYQRYIAIVQSNSARALGYSDLAVVYQAMRNTSEAHKAAAAERRENPKMIVDSLLLTVAARSPTVSTATLDPGITRRFSTQERGTAGDLRTYAYYRGLSAMQRRDKERALSAFREAVHHLPPTSAIDSHEDCLALAYLSFDMAPEAAQEFGRILRINQNYPLAAYHLAQAYAQMHDDERQRGAYQTFLASWKAADPDALQGFITKFGEHRVGTALIR